MGRLHKNIEWIVNENGCHNCTSHSLGGSGYPQISINGVNNRLNRFIYSRDILSGGEIPKGLVVRHKCDNPLCINPKHLELGTPADNNSDMKIRGRAALQYGQLNGYSKLDDSDVVEILKSKEKQGSLAKRYNVSDATISLIKNNKSWVHIKRQ